MAVKRPQMNVLGIGSLWPFPGAPTAHMASPDPELWEGRLPVRKCSLLDGWQWRLKLSAETRQQEGGKHWSPRQTLGSKSNNQGPCSPRSHTLRGWRWGAIYSSLCLLVRCISMFFQPLIAWFPCGSGQKEFFSWRFYVPKRPGWKSSESCFY